MDRELNNSLRYIRSSGRTFELFEGLLEDASWDTIIKVEKMVRRVRCSYRLCRFARAFSCADQKLLEFKLVLGPDGIDVPVDHCTRTENQIVFHTNWKPTKQLVAFHVSLFDDERFCFGVKPFNSTGRSIYPTDILRLTYTLGINDGII